jgi:hypothetical protein
MICVPYDLKYSSLLKKLLRKCLINFLLLFISILKVPINRRIIFFLLIFYEDEKNTYKLSSSFKAAALIKNVIAFISLFLIT